MVGQLVEAPQIKTSRAGAKYAVMRMQTGRPVKRDGKKVWVFVEHRVICFKQNALPMIERKGEKNVWMKVHGELGYLSGGQSAQIVVNEDQGSVGLMFADVWPDHEITDEEYELVGAVDGAGGDSGGTKTTTDDEIPF
ncbi:hypothetical protein Salmuc_01740 [Salipiger mucosus DSM 16094]|uniref:Single-stranded DNA-binding protein n=1 Tax=Salipiger mucosus DSM 16094 TaxID=1123237 RepID=S9S173_9RHOB|nr:hypothetical protein Salmuc_01740 [Salipiger mucosus DSM 16094]